MSEITGLTSTEVKDRFAKKQYNRSTQTKTKTIREILVEKVKDHCSDYKLITRPKTFYIQSISTQ